MPPTPINTNSEHMDCQEDQTSTRTGPHSTPPQTEHGDYLIHEQPFSIENRSDSGVSEALRISNNIVQPDQGLSACVEADASSSNHQWVDTPCQGDDPGIEESSSARFQQTSHHICWTLTIDWFAPSEVPTQSSFSYFIQEVDSPILSPFDFLNWARVKTYVAQLGIQETSVATSIQAVQALYRAQVNRLPVAHAMSVYQAAITSFESISGNEAVDFHIVLVGAFLLCLSVATLPNEDGPTFSAFDGPFVTRLEAWLLNGHPSPVSLRIGAWIQFLHTSIKRVGAPGLLSEPVSSLLYNHITEVPSLSELDCGTHPTNGLYDIISAPVFAFYLELQRISNQVADVSHYRRSRITPADQAEVTDLLAGLKTNMRRLWEARPSPLRLQPGQLREQFGRTIADPLIALAGVCVAAYFAEVVVIGRTLGDPPQASAEAIQAMKQIWDIVEGDWDASKEAVLNPGYLRPLFLYAIESLQKDETQWAVDCIRKIKNPMSRSDFIASLADALGEAQKIQGRRVTTKAFSYQTFGVPPPCM
jgi:hypothetical protein